MAGHSTIDSPLVREGGKFVFSVNGFCCICDADVEFRAERDNEVSPIWYRKWFRDSLRCMACHSIPRERALMSVIQMFYPNWRNLRVHESSPVHRGASRKMEDQCAQYTKSQYDPALPFGSVHPHRGHRSEDLEKQTFSDAAFDLVITQDVFEHLFAPDRAIKEIGRTLAAGGAHIMTVPIANGVNPSARRARSINGEVEHILTAQYHGNPISNNGSLVTIDWGYDIMDYLSVHSGLSVSLVQTDNLSRGIYASHTDVFMCKKIGATLL